jgi:hypothetical protein
MNCDVCAARIFVKDSFFDTCGQRVCRLCKGNQDSAAATKQSQMAGGVPYRAVGMVIALIALIPYIWLRSGGDMTIVLFAVVALVGICALVMRADAKNRGGGHKPFR